ncbi:MAG: RidA family protein [Desulfobulbus sp.]|jgi:2-iminobutanoate/2-iminopropanoate deaminase|nr:RidA family protein [Desulfobulbus sp.]
MTRSAVHTDQAPAAIGPYSQAVRSGNLLFVSGTLPVDARTGQMVPGDIEAQAHQVFRNLTAIAAAAGGRLADAVKVTVFLTDLGTFQRVNGVYRQYFQEPYPARSAVQVAALPLGAPIEVEAIIIMPEAPPPSS